ncbi:FixH family protein [Riemerella columbipharyngis]|uniref:FixH protein n=1 Tax=Riemerella columbipharyngis TaxID=1071918 RepID=A0A1G7E5M6_9FLAO|nr:FixH family protein [Riemerella columbipharyngis]SDE58800.1 FixH protein [Riemerella columbipharyngis]
MKKNKFTWGHGVILALASFIGFILYMIFVFSHGQQNSELVSENYYQEEMGYQKVIDAKNNAKALPEAPNYKQNRTGITVTFPKDINNQNSTFSIYLYRVDNKNLDIRKKMVLDKNNSFFIPAKVLVYGGYILKVSWTKDNTDYQIDYDLEWK